MDEKKKLFGLRIKNYRKKSNISQEILCDMLNIDTTTLSRIENGKNFPSFENFCTIIKILKIEPNKILDFVQFDYKEENIIDSLIFEYIKTLAPKVKKQILELIKTIK